MPNPQQPELRRSERIPALHPDASEAVLSAQSVPSTTDPEVPVPEEQRPGHDPAHDQDKPDMDAMAERLGVVAEGAEPETHTETDEPFSIASLRKRRRALALAIAVPAASAVVAGQLLRRFRRS